MKRFALKFLLVGLSLMATWVYSERTSLAQATDSESPLTVVVMDPLCDKLACDCVQGFAQRKYEVLGQHLQKSLGRKVEVFWGESIEAALKDESVARKTPLVADIVIGKHSVVVAESKARQLGLEPLAQLTGLDGLTTQTGLVVVRSADPAILVDDLAGYRIIFGPANCDEKHAAPRQLLLDSEISLPTELETSSKCSLAAQLLLDSPQDEKVAAIISSYAVPLLEGCGTIEKGALRVIGKSDPVPFISLFLRSELSADSQSEILSALIAVGKDSNMLRALESRDGFVPFRSDESTSDATGTEPVVLEKKTK
ncbi:MAG: PhnD/SsuA/transferrin family substrate-binding protein [Planctomycetaceae bacterium]|nr:PhnD/SsuA/transferrin family substrate-binding protein [Planctomycetaceae bacterium]